MKKLICAVLALCLLLSCCTAFASSPVFNNKFNWTAEQFIAACNNLISSFASTSLTWESEPVYTYGYPMYVGVDDTGYVYLSAHDKDGVFGIEIDGFIPVKDESTFAVAANNIGQIAMVTYIAASTLNGNSPDKTTISNMVNEIVGFFSFAFDGSTTDESLESGVEKTGIVGNMPSMISLHMTEENGERYLEFLWIVLAEGSTFQ